MRFIIPANVDRHERSPRGTGPSSHLRFRRSVSKKGQRGTVTAARWSCSAGRYDLRRSRPRTAVRCRSTGWLPCRRSPGRSWPRTRTPSGPARQRSQKPGPATGPRRRWRYVSHVNSWAAPRSWTVCQHPGYFRRAQVYINGVPSQLNAVQSSPVKATRRRPSERRASVLRGRQRAYAGAMTWKTPARPSPDRHPSPKPQTASRSPTGTGSSPGSLGGPGASAMATLAGSAVPGHRPTSPADTTCSRSECGRSRWHRRGTPAWQFLVRAAGPEYVPERGEPTGTSGLDDQRSLMRQPRPSGYGDHPRASRRPRAGGRRRGPLSQKLPTVTATTVAVLGHGHSAVCRVTANRPHGSIRRRVARWPPPRRDTPGACVPSGLQDRLSVVGEKI